ncbi:hypothetical protein [Streptomyces massasporeus]|uniref:hypothetical protein n=1 Tax=Streptomyces massasporeus TaxID=67324 RepID=UPI00371D6A9D
MVGAPNEDTTRGRDAGTVSVLMGRQERADVRHRPADDIGKDGRPELFIGAVMETSSTGAPSGFSRAAPAGRPPGAAGSPPRPWGSPSGRAPSSAAPAS